MELQLTNLKIIINSKQFSKKQRILKINKRAHCSALAKCFFLTLMPLHKIGIG